MKKINLIYAAAIALMLAGCSADTSVSDVSSADTVVSASSDVVSSSDSSDENSNESAQSENESDNTEVMMKVTSCDGNTITGNKMVQGMGEPPQMGDKPEGEPPADGNSDGNISVSLDENSTWNLTSDSYISSFEGDISNINAGEFHLYVNGEMIV